MTRLGRGDPQEAIILAAPAPPAPPPPAVLEQTRFRWRNDDGSETSATWKAPEDTDVSVTLDTPVRLRAQVLVEGDTSPFPPTLYYKKSTDSIWLPAPIGSGGGDPVYVATSANITAGGEPTTPQLTAPGGPFTVDDAVHSHSADNITISVSGGATVDFGNRVIMGTSAATNDDWSHQAFIPDALTYLASTGDVVTEFGAYGDGTGSTGICVYEIASGVVGRRINPAKRVDIGSAAGWYSSAVYIPLTNGTRYTLGFDYELGSFWDPATQGSWNMRYGAGPGGTQMQSDVRSIDRLSDTWAGGGSDTNRVSFYGVVTQGAGALTGGSATWNLLASYTAGSTNTNAFTTPALDTTGANLIVVHVAVAGRSGTLSDSLGNTWNEIGSLSRSRMFWCASPTVGSSHTFTSPGGSPEMTVAAFSGAAASPLITDCVEYYENTTGQAAMVPGCITPPETNVLVLLGDCNGDTTNLVTCSGVTIIGRQTQVDAQHVGGGMALKVLSTPTTLVPSWGTAGAHFGATIAAFRAGS